MNSKENKGKTPFYITTTLPYVNSKPHIGFAMEIIRADAVARYKRLLGHDVFFNTGTDEHGTKIYQKAKEENKDTQKFVDENAENFKKLKETLNLSFNKFIRTTDIEHKEKAQEFWKRCKDNGFIYKKNYKGLYCVGCEMFITEKDLVDGKCPLHPDRSPEIVEEENYFFAYSKFEEKLLELYKKEDFVFPSFRLNEIRNFVKSGLEDFSISRIKEKMPWGISVPDDDKHVMYVWFDALVNYVSTLGWPDSDDYKMYWEGGTTVQYCGKDNLQQQAARWQAMLLSVGLKTTDHIIVDGFITSGGQKMSKSLGNVIDPAEIVNEYGTDALRYYLLRELSPFEDSDFTKEKFKEAYNANLANGLGNLASRIMKMSEDNLDKPIDRPENIDFPDEYKKSIEKYDFQKTCDYIWQRIGVLDEKIQKTEPFKLVKKDREKGIEVISELVFDLYCIAELLQPIIPNTSDKIKEAVINNIKPESLFKRKD